MREANLKRALAAACLLMSACVCAAEKPQTFPTGWRGDGTGVYPDATPPLAWGRVGPVLKGLRCQAAKPKSEGESGNPIPFGIITDWLALAPLDVKDHDHPLDAELLPKEAELHPDEGEKAGSLEWKAIKSENHFADFDASLGKEADKAGYFHSYVYSPVDGALDYRTLFNYSGPKLSAHKIWLNGKVVDPNAGRFSLKKGWNEILLKICKLNAAVQFYFKFEMCSAEPCVYENRNITWAVPLPFSASTPIVVGEKVFICFEPHYLACLNKSDGKLLWIRSNGYHNAADEAERAAHAEFSEAAPLAAKIEEIDTALLKGPPSARAPKERDELLKAIDKLMQKVDPVKYKPNPEQVGNAGYAGLTPCSDGKFVYAWFGTGVTACYDLDGKRQWIRVDNHGWSHHGYASSPLLVDGKVVVYMRSIQAFDCKTGKVAWEQNWKCESMCMFGSWTKATVGNSTVIASSLGSCLLSATDGKVVYGRLPNGGCGICTPIFDNNILYFQDQQGPMNRLELSDTASSVTAKPMKPIDLGPKQFPVLHMGKHNYASSPVIYEGLLYMVDIEGDLIVMDTKTEAIVYQRKLDINALFSYRGWLWPHEAGICASPSIAGKHLYIQGNTGVMLIVEPGREFKQLAKNKIENANESFVCSPVFDGNRLFLHGCNNLYCIAEK